MESLGAKSLSHVSNPSDLSPMSLSAAIDHNKVWGWLFISYSRRICPSCPL